MDEGASLSRIQEKSPELVVQPRAHQNQPRYESEYPSIGEN